MKNNQFLMQSLPYWVFILSRASQNMIICVRGLCSIQTKWIFLAYMIKILLKVWFQPPPLPVLFFTLTKRNKIWHFTCDFCYLSTKNCHYRHYFWQLVTHFVVQKLWSIFGNFFLRKLWKTGGCWPPPPQLWQMSFF